MKRELKTLINVHKNCGCVIALLEMATEGRTSNHGWREKPSDGAIADWILHQTWKQRDDNPYWHLVASQAWREYFDSLSEIEQMMHLSDEDDDDWVDPRSWLKEGECDYPVERIIPRHIHWKGPA